ncbi:MAG: hypothetical protein ACK40X_00300 [Armatimonadota bacterium]
MRFLKLLPALVLLLCGCQGSSRHTIETSGQGSLEGLRFIPADHSRGVDTDTDPEIFWLPGYEPPSRFTVSLKRINEYGDLYPVATDLTPSGTNRWKLKVVGTLNEGTLYAIIVHDDTRGDQREAWFLTKKYGRSSKAPPNTGEGEHTVIVKPQP